MTTSDSATPKRRSPVTSAEKNARKAAPITALSQHLASNGRVAPALVGARIRARRLQRGISLRQFARDLEVSASFISQLETGKASPSVATLFAICAALDLSTDELFDNDATVSQLAANGAEGATDASNNPWRSASSFGTLAEAMPAHTERPATNGSAVVHPHERRVLVLDSGVTWESLTATRNEKSDFMFVRYDVGGSSTMEGRLIRHVGTEYGFILSGTLEVTVGFDTYLLMPGDSISFDSSRPHRLTNIGDVPVEALWFNLEFNDHT
ncbi:MAG TPA: XRE family transcriptional regulator [Acidimicrobiales bacterium]|nr:XRE family transcriptional regulator [Acidimicrobiales bacterium]